MRTPLFAFVAFSAVLSAAPLITSTASCSVPDVGYIPAQGGPIVSSVSNPCGVSSDYVSNPDSVSYVLYHQFASALATSNYSQSGNTFTLDFRVSAASTPAGGAFASFAFTDTYNTAGPVRQGTLRGWFQPSVNRYGGIATVGSSYPGQLGPILGPGAGALSITLGQPFTVSAYATARSSSDDGTQSFIGVDSQFSLSFFEADGVTPVALTEVPEPSDYALISSVIFALAVADHLRKLQTQPKRS